MSVEEPQPPSTYISNTGTVRSYRELERGAWEHSTPTDLTETPVVISGIRFYPVTTHSTFVVNYDFDGSERTDIAVDITRLEDRTDTQTAETADPALQFTFITPNGKETRVIPEANIRSVTPESEPSGHFPITAATQRDQARELESYASLHPYAVDPSHIITFLTGIDTATTRSAIAALRYIVDERPSDCISATYQLRELLTDPPDGIARDALYCLSHIATAAPGEAVVATSVLPAYFTHDVQDCREHALKAAAEITTETDEFLDGHESVLVDRLTARSTTERVYAAKLLAAQAKTTPEAVIPHLSELVDRLSATVPRPDEQIAAMSAVGRVSKHDPTTTIGFLDEIAECLTDRHEKLSANAASTLYDIASKYPDDVAQHIDSVARLLSSETSYTRLNATGALARLARTHPERVAPHATALVPCLYDDRREVRVNTCWVFERLGEKTSVGDDELHDVALNDADSDVRTRAYWAADALKETDASDSLPNE